MGYHDVRAGLQQAQIGRDSWGLLLGEAMVAAGAVGYYSQSLSAGVITFVALFVFIVLASHAAALGLIIAFFMSCVWGIGAYYGALHIELNDAAALAVGILFGFVGMGVHAAGFEYIRDVNRSD